VRRIGFKLTEREIEALHLFAETGLGTHLTEIAKEVGIAPRSMKARFQRIYLKLGVPMRDESPLQSVHRSRVLVEL
jgi:DNA-binding NarL/FixJ family response regulator